MGMSDAAMKKLGRWESKKIQVFVCLNLSFYFLQVINTAYRLLVILMYIWHVRERLNKGILKICILTFSMFSGKV